MNNKSCPVENLSLLISDELSIPDTESMQSHLDSCKSCREQLEALAADESWWERATTSLGSSAKADSSPEFDWLSRSDSVVVELVDTPTNLSETFTVGSQRSLENESRSRRMERALLDSPGHPEMLGRIDGFDVEQKIGQGGMGIVFRGFDPKLNRPVAIKLLAPHLASSGVARKRFAREAQAAAAVRHPNVVPIYSVPESKERPYIVMALVDGYSLQEYVMENGPLEIQEAVRVAHQIASGLNAAHKQGLIHRDIKPANVLMEKDVSRAMITDFGLARAADDVAMTQTGWLAGTPHYMSPEQAMGNDIDQRSDLFSLGSVIYFMVTGREPFRAEKPLAVLKKINGSEPISASSINSAVPKTLDQIIRRLHSKDPASRFESAEELEQILAKYVAHLQHPQSFKKPVVAAPELWQQRIRMIAIAIGFIACLTCGLLFLNNWKASSNRNNTSNLENTGTLNSDSSTTTDPTEWMTGLRPHQEWADDVAQLERDIFALEQEFEVPTFRATAQPERVIVNGIENQQPQRGVHNQSAGIEFSLKSVEQEIREAKVQRDQALAGRSVPEGILSELELERLESYRDQLVAEINERKRLDDMWREQMRQQQLRKGQIESQELEDRRILNEQEKSDGPERERASMRQTWNEQKLVDEIKDLDQEIRQLDDKSISVPTRNENK